MKLKERKKSKKEYVIQSVIHAIDLLEAFKGDTDELGVTELSKKLGLHKNNVFRLLATLELRGYIEQDKQTGNYKLGVKVLELGQQFVKHLGLLRQAHPVMRDLLAKCNENIYISVLRGNSCVYIDGLEANQVVKVTSRIGNRLPIHATASGKVLLANETEDELLNYFPQEELKKFTDNTISSRKVLFEQIKQARENGYALDMEELDLGVRCVAAPIRDYTRKVVGAISVSAPSLRMDDEKIKNFFVPIVVEAAKEISHRLGYLEEN